MASRHVAAGVGAAAAYVVGALLVLTAFPKSTAAGERERLYREPIDLHVPPVSTDKSVRYDYDIVYVRAPRRGDRARSTGRRSAPPDADGRRRRPDAAAPRRQGGGARQGGGRAAPSPTRWCRSTASGSTTPTSTTSRARAGAVPPAAGVQCGHLQDPREDAKVVRLTHQEFTPNTGAADWSKDFRTPRGGQDVTSSTACSTWARARCPAAGWCSPATATPSGRRSGYPTPVALQLFVMDDDGGERRVQIGHLNLGMAPAPGRPEGRPDHVQLAGVAGAAQRRSCGASGASTPTAPTGGRSSAPSTRRRRAERLPLPDAALRRQHRRRGVLQPEQQRLRHLLQVPAAAAGGYAAFGPAYTRRPAQPAAAARPARQRPAASLPACRSARTASRRSRRSPATATGPADRVGPRQTRTRRASASSRTRPRRRTTTC